MLTTHCAENNKKLGWRIQKSVKKDRSRFLDDDYGYKNVLIERTHAYALAHLYTQYLGLYKVKA